ncbi:SMI1/KNR4 family protein [Neptuniibacter sp. QD34_54]|uniref:SMI1/KNR4 family protein n=1 Tax=Neptuniibacter sp. QD34_54 TaxID=3398208 RepID=UPI0039F63C65
MSHKYSTEKLPNGFEYPNDFNAEVFQGLYPWIEINCESELGEMLLNLGKEIGNNLIPFASLELGDGDAACFDGNDKSGNPTVVMLVLDGSNRSYGFDNFNHWLQQAKLDANKWGDQ